MNLLLTRGMYAAEIDVNTCKWRIIRLGMIGGHVEIHNDKSKTLNIAKQVCEVVLQKLDEKQVADNGVGKLVKLTDGAE